MQKNAAYRAGGEVSARWRCGTREAMQRGLLVPELPVPSSGATRHLLPEGEGSRCGTRRDRRWESPSPYADRDRPWKSPSPCGRGVGVRVRRKTANLTWSSPSCPYPHPALRATFYRREKDQDAARGEIAAGKAPLPTRTGIAPGKPLSLWERGWGEGAAEDSQPDVVAPELPVPSSGATRHLLPTGGGSRCSTRTGIAPGKAPLLRERGWGEGAAEDSQPDIANGRLP